MSVARSECFGGECSSVMLLMTDSRMEMMYNDLLWGLFKCFFLVFVFESLDSG